MGVQFSKFTSLDNHEGAKSNVYVVGDCGR